MNETNTFEFAEAFNGMIEKLLIKCKCIGNRTWGNPAGQTGELPTYEIISKYGTVWCATIAWCDVHGNENRKGIIATFPVKTKQTLGQIAEVIIPYEFSRRNNTRAFYEISKIEIRCYGKFTVGRAGLKKVDFFNYLNKINPQLIMLDEEGKQYINIFEYEDNMSFNMFADQIVKFIVLVDGFKKQYR
jgi:hypothetical protein